jgi:hypothetical protein
VKASPCFFPVLESPVIRPDTNGVNLDENTLDDPASLKFLQFPEDLE